MNPCRRSVPRRCRQCALPGSGARIAVCDRLGNLQVPTPADCPADGQAGQQCVTIAISWYWRLARFRPAGNKRNQNVRVLQCGLSIRTLEGQEMSAFILCTKIWPLLIIG